VSGDGSGARARAAGEVAAEAMGGDRCGSANARSGGDFAAGANSAGADGVGATEGGGEGAVQRGDSSELDPLSSTEEELVEQGVASWADGEAACSGGVESGGGGVVGNWAWLRRL